MQSQEPKTTTNHILVHLDDVAAQFGEIDDDRKLARALLIKAQSVLAWDNLVPRALELVEEALLALDEEERMHS
jgi:hypothetical protein